MQHKTIAFRLDVFDDGPFKMLRDNWPKNWVRRAWIPQTIADQVWAVFDFATAADCAKWESSLPTPLRECIDNALVDHASRYGWAVRNANGFDTGAPAHNTNPDHSRSR